MLMPYKFARWAERASCGYPASAALLLSEQLLNLDLSSPSTPWAERASSGYPASTALLLLEQRA